MKSKGFDGFGTKFAKVEELGDGYDDVEESRVEASKQKANLISSMTKDGSGHKPVLDIDMEARLVPSSTKGHYHLFIDKKLSAKDYRMVLAVLVKVGIVQQGFLDGFDKRKATYVRYGVKK